jgi:hypothetical protein
MHPCLDAASAVVSAPVSPERPTRISRCAESVVPGDGTGNGWLPWLGISAWRYHRSRTTLGDGIVTSARVVCTVRGHAADLLIARALVEQMW